MSFFWILNRKKSQIESAEIQSFKSAYGFVTEMYKHGNFDDAHLSSKELTLKIKTAIHYLEESIRKILGFEHSSIESVAKDAKEKRKKQEEVLKKLYAEYKKADNLAKSIEKTKEKKILAARAKQEKDHLALGREEYREALKKKDYARMFQIAKKLAYTYPKNREAISLLVRSQKLYDTVKEKEGSEREQKDKVEKIIDEMKTEMTKKESGGLNIFSRMSTSLINRRIRSRNKKEQATKMAMFNTMEKLVKSASGINKESSSLSKSGMFDNVSTWLINDVSDFRINGFDFFWKIIGKDTIVGDTFGFIEFPQRAIFYFGDATGHGIQSGFTVALLSKLFYECSNKTDNFVELFIELNNKLKTKLIGRVFITGIFFEYDYKTGALRYIGAWHDPLLIYRRKTKNIEKVVAGGLALGVRTITNKNSISAKELTLEDGDIMFGYTDGLIEVRDIATNTLLGVDKLMTLLHQAISEDPHPQKIFGQIMRKIQEQNSDGTFQDDVSIFIFERNKNKDYVTSQDDLDSILQNLKESKMNSKKLAQKNMMLTREKVIEQVKKERYEREIRNRLERLDRLYRNDDFIHLKQETITYFKEWYVHPRMRFYLEKAIRNEKAAGYSKLDLRLKKKYNVLRELYKKWEYEIVIREIVDIISRNGKI